MPAIVRGIVAGPADAERVLVVVVGSTNDGWCTFKHNDPLASDGDYRLFLPGSRDLTVEDGSAVAFRYDYGEGGNWTVLWVGAGDWVQPLADHVTAGHPDAATLGHLQAHADDGEAHRHDLNSHPGITELVLLDEATQGPVLRLRRTANGAGAIYWEQRPDTYGIDQWGPSTYISNGAGGLSLGHLGGLAGFAGWLINNSGHLIPVNDMGFGNVGESSNRVGTLYVSTIDATDYGLQDSDIPSSIARDTEVSGAVTAHEGASDPHPGYLTPTEGNAAYEASGAVATHAGAADPHTGYVQESATPGGELGGTYATPSVDATHSGSSHAGVQAAAEATAAAALSGHVSAGDPHTGYATDGDLSGHAGDADAHHAWPLGDGDIPSGIARDSEVATAVSDHNALLTAHPAMVGNVLHMFGVCS